MPQLEQLQGDLRFVRAAVESTDRPRVPAAVYFLWAAIGFVGCGLVDLRPGWVAAYWGVAGPAGFALSAVLGWRAARREGQMSAAAGWRQALHWGGMLAAIGLVLLMPMRGVLAWEHVNGTILLILALGYFQAGVHFDRALVWVGVLMAGAYVLVILVPLYAWTFVGAVLAGALTVAGLRGRRPGEVAA